ncbi:hypothetical protein MTR_2g039683 [Medicago truncatula]|uniref:Uncharacterized protein n=1 Tax=Medicago truncatula TaxID=3880 RepID=A0A072V807_MEDTR|nr:hypothetical protein MTR_2g039683 [Medicago truncatula]
MGSDGDCGGLIHRQRQVILTVVVLYGERVDDSGSLIVTKLGLVPKDPERKIKVVETRAVRLSDPLVRLSEQVTVATRLVRFLVADWSLTSSLKRRHVRLSE